MKAKDSDVKAQKWMAQLNAVMTDADKRRVFLESPIDAMQKIGGSIDVAQQAAVARGFHAAALAHELQSRQDLGAFEVTRSKKQANNFEQHFHLKVEWWGFVMRVDHAAIKELPKGLDAVGTLAEAAFGVMKAAGEAGPLAPVIAMGLIYWGAIFTAYMVLLPELDKGKGVYLTVTWPQVGIAVASGGIIGFAALPVPTTVV